MVESWEQGCFPALFFVLLSMFACSDSADFLLLYV